jgi:hypothetical protein
MINDVLVRQATVCTWTDLLNLHLSLGNLAEDECFETPLSLYPPVSPAVRRIPASNTFSAIANITIIIPFQFPQEQNQVD